MTQPDTTEPVRLVPDPETGWRGRDLADDELSDDDYAAQFPDADGDGIPDHFDPTPGG